jgi:hypothetical protein
MADVIQFPDCCGLIVLNKFKGGHPGSDPNDCLSEEDCDSFLEHHEQAQFNKRAGLLAVLSEPQNERLSSVFRRRKWECLLEGKMNPRTNVRLWMYYRDLNYTKAREKRIFG